MVDFSIWRNSVFLVNPIYLLFLAPDDIPWFCISLFPLSLEETFVDTITKSSFEFNVSANDKNNDTNDWGNVIF
jgi:hypothetical protein